METIFACATAPVKSGVSIIRISGDKSFKALSALCNTDKIKPRYAVLRKIFNPIDKQLIDEALILWFPAPKSFTGEGVVELHIHGSLAVINEIMEVLSSFSDLRIAEAGEFSRRAFENGQMDLTEAEGLADLIDAETKMQARQAVMQSRGSLRELYDKWRKTIIKILANIEAYIDFPDEDIPEDVTKEIIESVSSLSISIKNHLNDGNKGEILRRGLYAAIIGAPNVGKSSLINHLAKRDVAIVSDVEGTTRDVIEVHLDIAGFPVILADTAGIREQAGEIEGEGIKRALQKAEDANLKIIMLSSDNLESDMIKYADENTIVIINKADLAGQGTISGELAKYKPILISVTENKGLDQFYAQLKKWISENFSMPDDPLITRTRHRNLLTESVKSLDKFSLEQDIVTAAEDLRIAATSLGKITGHIDIEEILDEIFSSFCIGK